MRLSTVGSCGDSIGVEMEWSGDLQYSGATSKKNFFCD